MKKILFVIIALAVMISLSACVNLAKEKTYEGSLNDLFEKNEKLKCVMVYDDSEDMMNGTVYFDGKKKMRADFEHLIDGQTSLSHLISDEEWMYTWSSMMAQGMKMNIKEMEETFKDFKDDEAEVSLDAWQDEFTYKCSKWRVDDSVFELPQNIEFVDWTQMLSAFGNLEVEMDTDNLQDSSDNEKVFDLSELCENCNFLSGEEKEECLISLGCN